jgi:hypothetical protein
MSTNQLEVYPQEAHLRRYQDVDPIKYKNCSTSLLERFLYTCAPTVICSELCDWGKCRFSTTFQNDNFNSKKRQVTQVLPIKIFPIRIANNSNHLHHQSIGSQVKPTTCSDITGVINAATA